MFYFLITVALSILYSYHTTDGPVPDLLVRAAAGGVGDSPGGLLARLELGVAQDVDERRKDVGVDDGLDLVRVAGRDVGQRPAGLLTQRLGGVPQQRQQRGQRRAVEHGLRLSVVARHHVAHGA